MRTEVHDEQIKEVLREIDAALNDPEGIVSHQSRLASMLSLGAVNLIESYLHKLNMLPVDKILDHRLFKKKPENVKKNLVSLSGPDVEKVPRIDEILKLANSIESGRNKLVYGARVSEEILKAKTRVFVELRKEVESGSP